VDAVEVCCVVRLGYDTIEYNVTFCVEMVASLGPLGKGGGVGRWGKVVA